MRWGVLLLRIPDNWMTELLQVYDMKIRVMGCRPYGKNGGRGLVRIGSENNLDEILGSIQKRKEVVRTSFSHASDCEVVGEVVLDRCAACTALRRSDCFMVSSSSKPDGWLKWHVAAESNGAICDLADLLKRNGCEVVLGEISAPARVHGLTQRQEEILLFAHSNGYFEYPKGIKLRDLSGIFNVSSSTISEILRAGQRRVFAEYFIPYMFGKK